LLRSIPCKSDAHLDLALAVAPVGRGVVEVVHALVERLVDAFGAFGLLVVPQCQPGKPTTEISAPVLPSTRRGNSWPSSLVCPNRLGLALIGLADHPGAQRPAHPHQKRSAFHG
jgi:hypothetical protein